MGVEQLDQFGEVGERTGETVDLVDDDDVDPALPDGLKKSLQGRTVEIAPEKPPSSYSPWASTQPS